MNFVDELYMFEVRLKGIEGVGLWEDVDVLFIDGIELLIIKEDIIFMRIFFLILELDLDGIDISLLFVQ